jgi:molecular chaperone DnaK (HSP70)
MKWKLTYGLDFGTSNTAITAWDWGNQKVITDPAFSTPEPTLLYFAPNRLENIPAVGRAAVDAFVAHHQEGRFFQALKTVLPQKSFTQTC